MSQIPAVGLNSGGPPVSKGAGDLGDLDLDAFMQLMIAEFQNQDPLDPLDNSEIVQQVSQIRQIGATNQLATTLDAVLTGQNLATGSGLIGKAVKALADDGERRQGIVDRVSIETSGDGPRSVRVHIGDSSFRLDNVEEIRQAGDAQEAIDELITLSN